MKKIIILLILLLVACSLNNTPEAKVEELLSKYQLLNKNIEINYQDLINDNNLTKENIKEIEKIIKKQYQNMTYEIKEEMVDGNSATVTSQIEVYNYKKIIENNYLNKDYKKTIKELKKTKEKITYTINFKLTKNKNEKWKLKELTDEEKNKLLGIF